MILHNILFSRITPKKWLVACDPSSDLKVWNLKDVLGKPSEKQLSLSSKDLARDKEEKLLINYPVAIMLPAPPNINLGRVVNGCFKTDFFQVAFASYCRSQNRYYLRIVDFLP